MKENLEPQTALAPIPAVMVSCGNMEKSNILTIAWTGIINSEPPLCYVSIRPTRYSYNIIKENREFVINMPGEKLVWETDLCGTKTGKDIDKFKIAKLTKQECKFIKAPAIKECPISLECKVKEITNLGSHDMILADVIAVNVDEELLDENGNILFEKANLISFAGKKYFLAKEVEDRGVCLKKKLN